jgi:hypothetical protein
MGPTVNGSISTRRTGTVSTGNRLSRMESTSPGAPAFSGQTNTLTKNGDDPMYVLPIIRIYIK